MSVLCSLRCVAVFLAQCGTGCVSHTPSLCCMVSGQAPVIPEVALQRLSDSRGWATKLGVSPRDPAGCPSVQGSQCLPLTVTCVDTRSTHAYAHLRMRRAAYVHPLLFLFTLHRPRTQTAQLRAGVSHDRVAPGERRLTAILLRYTQLATAFGGGVRRHRSPNSLGGPPKQAGRRRSSKP